MSSMGPLTASSSGNPHHALHGDLRESELAATESLIRIKLPDSARSARAGDSRGATAAVIQQSIESQLVTPPARVVLVLDRGPGMAGLLSELERALMTLPAGIEWGVVAAGDEPRWLHQSDVAATNGSRNDLARTIRRFDCAGGHDNLAALAAAFDWAGAKSHSSIVWIHGAQPVELSSAEPLRQRLERDTQGTRILSLQAGVGPNRILERLDGLPAVASLPRAGSFTEDLKNALQACQQGTALPALRRERREISTGDAPAGVTDGSLHLARLWANDEVRRLMGERHITEAVALAARYQLVTPVTAAVVLETRQQFQQHGLQPVDPATVPSIPEPGAFSLVLLGGLLLRWMLQKKCRGST